MLLLKQMKMGNRKLSCDLTDSVKDHIKSFPIMESHYVRARSNRQYLSSSLSLLKMFDLYLGWNRGKPCVSHQTYLNIFNFDFNLGFHKPKEDMCDRCIEFKNATPQQQTKLQYGYDAHILNKNLERNFKYECKEKSMGSVKYKCLAFDLQKVLEVPLGENGLFYYKRKLAMYNLTVTDIVNGQVYCYMWDQTIAKRGGSEVGSCINMFINP